MATKTSKRPPEKSVGQQKLSLLDFLKLNGTLTVLTVSKKGKSGRVLIGFRTWSGRELIGIGQSL